MISSKWGSTRLPGNRMGGQGKRVRMAMVTPTVVPERTLARRSSPRARALVSRGDMA